MKTTIATFLFLLCNVLGTIAQEYPIYVTEEGHLLVEVTLNDSVTGNFILDTGAGAIVLSQKMFDRVSSTAQESGFLTGFRHDGDRIDGIIYELPVISIGEVSMKLPQVGVYPPLDNFGIDGLLSLKFFENKPFSIDFKNQKITFHKAQEVQSMKEKGTTLPLSLYQHTNIALDIFIPICLNEKVTVNTEFDTGSGYGTLVVNPHYIKGLGIEGNEFTISTYTTPVSGNKIEDKTTRLSSMDICNSSFIKSNDVSVTFREGLIYEALMGTRLFSETKVTIDIPGKQFIVH